MPFQPAAGQELTIDAMTWRVAAHPAALAGGAGSRPPGSAAAWGFAALPYGQEGRQAVVYQLEAGAERRALKVFRARYRLPSLVRQADRLDAYADLPGLAVCRRTVLSPLRPGHAALLRQEPDLT